MKNPRFPQNWNIIAAHVAKVRHRLFKKLNIILKLMGFDSRRSLINILLSVEVILP